MANAKHLAFIKKALQGGGSNAWNDWRASKSRIDDVHGYMSLIDVDLSGADLSGSRCFSHLDLADVNFQNANLSRANFHSANLRRANLRGANLAHADLRRAVLDGADLSGALLRHGNFGAASLIDANLSGADLARANLFSTRLQKTNLQGADLSGCGIYGVSAWDLQLDNAIQSDLVITPPDSPTITVDNLEVAQFVYLLINNQSIRRVIDTLTSKAVLILGRFTDNRKPVLDAMRQALRERNYLPILFDFEKPAEKTLTETLSTLAHLSRFIIADITSAKSIPQELAVIVPHLPTVPVQPILAAKAGEYAMFEHFKHFPWVLELFRYRNQEHLIASLSEKVIAPAEAKSRKLASG